MIMEVCCHWIDKRIEVDILKQLYQINILYNSGEFKILMSYKKGKQNAYNSKA